MDKLQWAVEVGKIDPKNPVNIKTLQEAGLVGRVHTGVKLLASGKETLKTPLTIEVSRASQSAIEAVESVGGSIRCVYHNRLGLRAVLKPERFERLPRQALPVLPKLIEYYKNPDNRGYLADLPKITSLPSTDPK